MRCLILKGSSQYGSLRLHSDQCAAALQQLGHEVHLWDLEQQLEPSAELERFAAAGLDFLFSVQICTDMLVREQHLADYWDTTHICLSVDDPALHIERWHASGPRRIMLFLDASHLAWYRRMYGDEHCQAMAVIPPGGNILQQPAAQTQSEFFAQRPIELLFTGSLCEPKKRWHELQHPEVVACLDAACQLCMEQEHLPVADAIDTLLAEGEHLIPEAKLVALYALCGVVAQYLHQWRRQRLLHCLAQAGLPLTIYGSGFEDFAKRYPSVSYQGTGSFRLTLDKLQETQLVLSSNAYFVHGCHERVFAAQLAGAAVLSDSSNWYLDAYQDGVDIQLFHWTDIDALPQLVAGLLADPQRLYELAQHGQARSQNAHRWTDRWEQILALL